MPSSAPDSNDELKGKTLLDTTCPFWTCGCGKQLGIPPIDPDGAFLVEHSDRVAPGFLSRRLENSLTATFAVAVVKMRKKEIGTHAQHGDTHRRQPKDWQPLASVSVLDGYCNNYDKLTRILCLV